MQLMFTMTIGEVKNFTSLDLMAGRVPHELPGGDPCGRVPPGRVPTVDVLHRTGSALLGRRFEWGLWTGSIRTGSDYVVPN